MLLRLARAMNLGRSDAVRSSKIRVHDSHVDIELICPPSHGSGSGNLGGRKREKRTTSA